MRDLNTDLRASFLVMVGFLVCLALIVGLMMKAM